MTEQRHCPRCTMTFLVDHPKRAGGRDSKQSRLLTQCSTPGCRTRFWYVADRDHFTWVGVLPDHADGLQPGPYVPPLARAAE